MEISVQNTQNGPEFRLSCVETLELINLVLWIDVNSNVLNTRKSNYVWFKCKIRSAEHFRKWRRSLKSWIH